MGLNNPRFNYLASLPPLNGAIEKLSQLQSAIISEALGRAIDDMGAAMAHQLRDPLTSLLLYLHEIKQVTGPDGDEVIPDSLREIVDLALRETERVCTIMGRVSQTMEPSENREAATARNCEALESWTRRNTRESGHAASGSFHADQQSLTPREREVLDLITNGCSNKEGGYQLGISTRTFEAHRAHLMAKLGAKNAADLVRMTVTESR